MMRAATMSEKTFCPAPELSRAQAMALAQLCKRIGWNEMRVNAVDDAEAYEMRAALHELRESLAAVGFAPR